MRDGRLAGAELGAFARHMTTCGACADEARALDGLADGLRTGRVEPADELRVARERTRLLAAFDRSLLASEREWSGRWVLPIAAAIAVICCILVSSRPRPSSPLTPPSTAVVRADPDTVWSRKVEGGRENVTLVRGALAVHVDHGASHRERLVVVLPDGELEDIGTTFTVAAARGHTERVTVQEGSVLLRLRGRAPIALSAGEAWTPDRAPPATGRPAVGASSPSVERPERPGPAHRERIATSQPPSAAPSGGQDSSDEFRALVRLLDAGDDCQAAAGFLQFAVRHPSDSHAEDAAYLRVIALRRCGADDEMKRAAIEYLRVHPHGFRRAEVERLSR
jgi:hypothetical protein